MADTRRKMCMLLLYDKPYVTVTATEQEHRSYNLRNMVRDAKDVKIFDSISELVKFMKTVDGAQTSVDHWHTNCIRGSEEVQKFINGEVEKLSTKSFQKRKEPYSVNGYGNFLLLLQSDEKEYQYQITIPNSHTQKAERSPRIAAIEHDKESFVVGGKPINFLNLRSQLVKKFSYFKGKINMARLKAMKSGMPDNIDVTVLKVDNGLLVSNVRYLEVNYRNKTYKWYCLSDFKNKVGDKGKMTTMALKRNTSPHGSKYIYVKECIGENLYKDTDELFIEESQFYALCLGCSKEIRDWVTTDILPSINQKGSYDVATDGVSTDDVTDEEVEYVESEPFDENAIVSVNERAVMPIGMNQEVENEKRKIALPIVKNYRDNHGNLTSVDLDVLSMCAPNFYERIKQTNSRMKAEWLINHKDSINVVKAFLPMIKSRTKEEKKKELMVFYEMLLRFTGMNQLVKDKHNWKEKLDLLNGHEKFTVVDKMNIFTLKEVWNSFCKLQNESRFITEDDL